LFDHPEVTVGGRVEGASVDGGAHVGDGRGWRWGWKLQMECELWGMRTEVRAPCGSNGF
jgi:hypothetical protein